MKNLFADKSVRLEVEFPESGDVFCRIIGPEETAEMGINEANNFVLLMADSEITSPQVAQLVAEIAERVAAKTGGEMMTQIAALMRQKAGGQQ